MRPDALPATVPLLYRPFIFEREHFPGFSRSLYVRFLRLNFTASWYRGNWYLSLMWAQRGKSDET